MKTIEKIQKRVADFLQRVDMSKSRFGRDVTGNPNFVDLLMKSDAVITTDTMDKINVYISKYNRAAKRREKGY